ncbi:hypothetical protein CY0110_03789 [Crocosphaera chwakensis CCY0110]|uniref:Uncharacterized protein n=1 Tax=Crocosphaera chwakensis CCY0110 TaxID=391612 RepID=A3IKH1_9CHRO|nr:hypothetical protein CY0110_03789 [Crocosphaera chwakensis CCY0110]
MTGGYRFHMIIGLIKVNIENLWLPNENAQKEKE